MQGHRSLNREAVWMPRDTMGRLLVPRGRITHSEGKDEGKAEDEASCLDDERTHQRPRLSQGG